MEKQTFERALHMWDKWHESIELSRSELGFDVNSPAEDRIKWLNDHVPELREQGGSELKKLDLPPSLLQYWVNCLINDYRTQYGGIDYSKITSFVATESNTAKALPELPCEHGLVWYDNEDIHDPWIRVEIKIHTRFATKELFAHAAEYAFMAIETHLASEQVQPHPICQWLKGGRPPADESLALECSHFKDDLKWTYKELAEHYGWPMQNDSYGNPTQCSSARRYVKWGRELRG
ncbi:hypothetical protein ACFLXU_06820 [Chloroflexota bacterium]